MTVDVESVAEVAAVVRYLETVTRAHTLWHQQAEAPSWQRPFEALILEIGQPWLARQLPRTIRPGTPKLCYHNAERLVRRSRGRLRYVEGFALGPNSPLPVAHAWAADEQDRVVDPTWIAPDRSAYYGVEIPLASLTAMTTIAGLPGFFGSDYRVEYITLKLGRIPTPAELLLADEAYSAHQRGG